MSPPPEEIRLLLGIIDVTEYSFMSSMQMVASSYKQSPLADCLQNAYDKSKEGKQWNQAFP